MARYIDIDKLLYDMDEIKPINWTDSEQEIQEQLDYKDFKALIEKQPVADAVEVVRCKDCKYYNVNNCVDSFGRCLVNDRVKMDNEFCSYGEQKPHKEV